MKSIDRKIINLLSIFVVLLVNILANTLPINGKTTGDISNQFTEVYFTPAGYVFSIWLLIYIMLIGFSIYQAMPKIGETHTINKIGYMFALTCTLNSAWIFAWHYNLIILSLLIMIALLVSLIIIYRRLDMKDTSNKWERIFVKAPFSLYLSWISVATIANLSVVLSYAEGWNINPIGWTVLMIILGGIVASSMILFLDDWVFPIVYIWAFIGISIRNYNVFSVFIAGLIIALTLSLLLYKYLTNTKNRKIIL